MLPVININAIEVKTKVFKKFLLCALRKVMAVLVIGCLMNPSHLVSLFGYGSDHRTPISVLYNRVIIRPPMIKVKANNFY